MSGLDPSLVQTASYISIMRILTAWSPSKRRTSNPPTSFFAFGATHLVISIQPCTLRKLVTRNAEEERFDFVQALMKLWAAAPAPLVSSDACRACQ